MYGCSIHKTVLLSFNTDEIIDKIFESLVKRYD